MSHKEMPAADVSAAGMQEKRVYILPTQSSTSFFT